MNMNTSKAMHLNAHKSYFFGLTQAVMAFFVKLHAIASDVDGDEIRFI